jgi:hypothetical protein
MKNFENFDNQRKKNRLFLELLKQSPTTTLKAAYVQCPAGNWVSLTGKNRGFCRYLRLLSWVLSAQANSVRPQLFESPAC